MVEDSGRVIQNAGHYPACQFLVTIYMGWLQMAALHASERTFPKPPPANQALAIQRRVMAPSCDGALLIALVFLA